MGRKYTDDEFIEAVKNSRSIREALSKIGVHPTGGNYNTAHQLIKKLNLDSSHFTGKGYLKGKTHNWSPKTPLQDLLVENYCGGVTTHHLRIRLIKENILQAKCYKCGNTEWNGLPISLELEHKNGNRHDNRIDNLELLCPNCHAQTDTYRKRKNRT